MLPRAFSSTGSICNQCLKIGYVAEPTQKKSSVRPLTVSKISPNATLTLSVTTPVENATNTRAVFTFYIHAIGPWQHRLVCAFPCVSPRVLSRTIRVRDCPRPSPTLAPSLSPLTKHLVFLGVVIRRSKQDARSRAFPAQVLNRCIPYRRSSPAAALSVGARRHWFSRLYSHRFTILSARVTTCVHSTLEISSDLGSSTCYVTAAHEFVRVRL